MVHIQSDQVSWLALYLFLVAGVMGHAATFMLWRGIYAHGMVFLVLDAVALFLFLDESGLLWELDGDAEPVGQEGDGSKHHHERAGGSCSELLPQQRQP